MAVDIKWMAFVVLLSLCTAEDSKLNLTSLTSPRDNEYTQANETNEVQSTPRLIPNGEESLTSAATKVEEPKNEENAPVTGIFQGEVDETPYFTENESSAEAIYGLLGSEDESPKGHGFDMENENSTILVTMNDNVASKMKAIVSLWNEVMNLAGNDSLAQEWTAVASALWKDMMTKEWNDLSVVRWNENMTLLWNEITTYLEELYVEPLDSSWNRTMVRLWNDFIELHMSGITKLSYFPGWDTVPPYSLNYSVVEQETTDWHSYIDYGWGYYPELAQNGGTDYPESNTTDYIEEPPYFEDKMIKVILKQGAILGKRDWVRRGGKYFYSFKGIPYAQPPVESLRFMDPVPASDWNGTRNGTIDSPRCPQLQFYITVGEEDCLYLNVYTPKFLQPYDRNLPVMVWIHGGSFVTGGADEYPPLPFMKKNIVLVTIQYRLGALGFLSTEDSVLPGNLALKDQTLALQWVKDNIHDLGGDPNKITIFGQGAGAASVHLQVISPKARGLFHRAIMQSGSALGQAVIRTDHKEVAMTVGKQYNCSTGEGEFFNSTLLLKCLQSLPLKYIVAIPSLFTMIVSLPKVMTPRVDGDFLPDHPAQLLKKGLYNKVDVITGINEHEGAIVALPFLLNPWLVNELMVNFEVAGPTLVSTEKEDEPVKLAREILDFYLHGQPVNIIMADDFVQMISDLSYRFDHDEVVKIHANDANFGFKIYSYEFQYRGQYSYTDNYGPEAGTHWVSHGDDLPYLFNNRLTILRRRDDFSISNLMISLWTNFALTGNPTPDNTLDIQWLPVSPTCFHYLAIDRIPYMKHYDRAHLMKFWKSLALQTNHYMKPSHVWQSFVPSTPTIQNCFG